MATRPQLEAQGRELTKRLTDIQNDETRSEAEKAEAVKAFEEDFKSWHMAVETSETASEMAAKLAGFGDASVEDDEEPVANLRTVSPWTSGMRERLAAAVVNAPKVKEISGLRAKSEFDSNFEVSFKDATETNNLMGEGLYGTSGPTAAGQNPFLPGAFGPGILPTWLPGIVEQLFYDLTLSDLISSIPVSTPNISYLTESTANLQANQVAESALYPFSSEEVSRVYEQVGKVANAMTLSDEAIRDAAYLFNFVQSRLLFSIQRQEEVQILAGGGYPGVNGLLNRSASFTASGSGSLFNASSGGTASSVAFPAAGTAGAGVQSQTIGTLHFGRAVPGATGAYPDAATVAENLMDAFVDIELQVFKKPNAIVMHPRDWEVLRLGKDSNKQYYGGSFFGADYGYGANTGKTLWNTPVVTTPLIPQHYVLTGWFDPATVQTARREGISMQMTNANGTDFVQGNVTIRAEERLGLLVYRPSAFQMLKLTQGS